MKATTTSADMVRSYLREIGRVPLLTHEQEILYGKQVRRSATLYETKEALEDKLGKVATLEEWAAQVNLPDRRTRAACSGWRTRQAQNGGG